MVAAAASGAGGDALRYFVAEKYVAAFQAIAASPTSRLVIVPMEAAGLAGGVTAALELLRQPSSTGPSGSGGWSAADAPRPMPTPPSAPMGYAPAAPVTIATPPLTRPNPWTAG
jgi:hypothetical protein